MPLRIEDIARVCRAKLSNVAANWPMIVAALEEFGIRNDLVEVAAAATVAVETGRTFMPINEYGGQDYFTKHYEGRADLGNCWPGDGARFHGRGYIQITGRANYRGYSNAAGANLEDHPEQALIPAVAARILAAYFAKRDIGGSAARREWLKVRAKVNGINRETGEPNGLDEFQTYVNGLLEILNAAA